MLEFETNRSFENNYIYHQNDINLFFKAHLHMSFEFAYVKKGSISITINEKKYQVNEKEAVLILPNQIHSYETSNYSESYLCVFSTSYIYDFYQKTKNMDSTNPVFKFDNEKIIERLQQVNDIYELKSILYEIVHLYNKNNTFIKNNREMHEIVEKVIEYSENHFSEEISLVKFAKEFGYSYNYLSNLINKTLNMNLTTLLNVQRINHAKHLLNSSSQSLTDIAFACGYKSVRSFNRNFKKIVNETPSDYQKKHTINH